MVYYIDSSIELDDDHVCTYNGPGWYFYDVTGYYLYGPYCAEIIALKAQDNYTDKMNLPRYDP